MKKLLLGLTLLISLSTFAHGDNETRGNKICGVSNIPLRNVFNAPSNIRVVELINHLKSEGTISTVCQYEEGVAVVMVDSSSAKGVWIFDD
jgi:hypothetical protein